MQEEAKALRRQRKIVVQMENIEDSHFVLMML
jgi:hypothetical protein